MVGPGDRRLRRRPRLGRRTTGSSPCDERMASAWHTCRADASHRTGHTADRAAPGAPVAPCSSLACVGLLGACSNGAPSAEAAPDGLLALVADADGTTLVGWDDSGEEPIQHHAPQGRDDLGRHRAWPASSPRPWPTARRRRATRSISASGSSGGRSRPVGPTGDPGPWTRHVRDAGIPSGGRYATLSGDLLTGDDVRVVLIDPSVSTAFEIPLDRSVVAAPPAWIDKRPVRGRDRRRRRTDGDHRRRRRPGS